jgi:hypothetical protein
MIMSVLATRLQATIKKLQLCAAGVVIKGCVYQQLVLWCVQCSVSYGRTHSHSLFEMYTAKHRLQKVDTQHR